MLETQCYIYKEFQIEARIKKDHKEELILEKEKRARELANR